MNKFLLFLSLLCFSACSGKLYYAREYRNWEQQPQPDSTKKIYSIYLIGDVGDPYHMEENLKVLSEKLKKDSNSTTIFLGDNIYQAGMPPEGKPGRKEAEKKMNRQIEVVQDYKGKPFFIPGNHDWDYMKREGWLRVREQEKYVEEKLDRGNTFIPDNGCPGPVRVSVTDDVAVIFLDTQWWLHHYNKPYGASSDCNSATYEEVLVQLRDIIEKNKNRHIVVAGHHPLFSNGNHGGFYNWLDYIFPLRLLGHRWYNYIPLPVIGSIYPLYRKFGGTDQDLASYKYQDMKMKFMDIFNAYKNIVYVSGHDHTLQYFKIEDFFNIISGSGCRTAPVRTGGKAGFIQKDYGFAVLSYYSNGEAWVSYYNPVKGKAVCSFRTLLYSKNEILPESFCTLSRLDYSDSTVTVAADKQYQVSKFTKWLLGKHYRKAWDTPIKVPILDLKTEKGGLIPYAIGGGKQSITLKFKNIDNREYVARSIAKDPGRGAIPPDLNNTFVEKLVQDQISAQHPFGAVTVPPLANAVGVLHTNPVITLIPADSCLGPYYDLFKNTLVLFEEDPDEDHGDAPNLGYSKNIIGTDKLLQNLREDNDNSVNQTSFARARLLDMFIGDWDRHEGQYRWAEFKKEGKGDYYLPVPKDHDMAYFKFDGLIPSIAGKPWAFRTFRDFSDDITDIKGLNQSPATLDRRFLSTLSKEDWIAIADSMQKSLTDSVIEKAIRQLPPEIFAENGERIIASLKQRRGELKRVAKEYYTLLSRYINFYGSDKHELFTINRIDANKTEVTAYKIKKEGTIKKELYRRTINSDETKELRIYGLGGEDRFKITGDVKNGILVRIIGGGDKDSIFALSNVSGLQDKTVVYDELKGAFIEGEKDVNNKLSEDPTVNDATDPFFYNYYAPALDFFYNQGDGFFLGLGAIAKRYKFKASPYGSKQRFTVSFASVTKSFRIAYDGDFRKVSKEAGLGIHAEAFLPYFAMNYFGYGNSSPFLQGSAVNYYRVRMSHIAFQPSIIHRPKSFLKLGIGPTFASYKLIKRRNSFVDNVATEGQKFLYDPQYYAGIKTEFRLGTADNALFPTRGIILSGKAEANQGLNQNHSFYTHFQTQFVFYITPNLPWLLTFAGRVGAAANMGDFAFYQANALGGTNFLRGYNKTRFVGDRMFYQNLEVRSEVFKIKNRYYKGKVGLAAFVDNGRVWPGGGTYHTTFGGGPWVSFVDRIVFAGYYGIAEDYGRIIFRIGFFY